LFLLALVQASTIALAVDPTFDIGGGVYTTGPENPISGRYLLHDPDRFPAVYSVDFRPGLRFAEHWGAELNVGWLQGNTKEYGYGLTMWYPRLEADYHVFDRSKPYDLFLAAGGGLTYTSVNRPSRADQSNESGLGLYHNPSLDGLLNIGPAFAVHAVGPLWIRTDLRAITTLGADGTPTRADTFEDFEWTVSLHFRAFHTDKAPTPEPEPAQRVDTDKDGLYDDEDRCPKEPEDKDSFQDADGCPDPDNDGDGILDVDDKCPVDPEDMDGFRDSDGCPDPDNDEDGLPDGKDKCPDVAENKNGYEDTDGCPDEIPAEVQRFTGVIEGIYFEYDKDVIEKKSEKTLNEALSVLQRFPDLKLEIQGHTDAKGDDLYNMDLSQRRAEAVEKWFVDHGIAATRFRAAGFGETTPIATNDTDDGRAKNRRVEFHPFSE